MAVVLDHGAQTLPKVALGILYMNVFLDLAGFGMALPMMPFLAEELHADAWGVGMVTTSYCLGQLVGNLLVGRLADRVGHKVTLCFCLLGIALSNMAMGFVQTLDAFIVLRATAGLCSGVVCIVQALVSVMVPPEENCRQQGHVGAAIGAGIAFGPGMGAFAVHFTSLRGPLLVAAALYTLNLLATMIFLTEPVAGGQQAGHEHDADPKLAEGTKAEKLREHLYCSPIYLSTIGFWTAYGAFEAIGGLYFADSLGMGAATFGLVCTVNGVGQLLVNSLLVGPVVRLAGAGGAGALACCCGALAYGVACVAAPWAPWIFALVLAFAFMATVVQATEISELSSPGRRGAALGTNQAAASLGRVIGPLLGASVYQELHEGLWILAVGGCCLSGLGFLAARALRRLGPGSRQGAAEAPRAAKAATAEGAGAGGGTSCA